MSTAVALAKSDLRTAHTHAATAEAHLSALAADQANSINILRLIYAATICGMAEVSLRTAHQILADVTDDQPQEVPHG